MPRTEGRLVVFGAGGHGREVAWLAGAAFPGRSIIFVVDDRSYLQADGVDGHEVALVDALEVGPHDRFVVALGDPAARQRAADLCYERGLQAGSIVHPGVDLRGDNELMEGSVLCAGTVITTGITIGCHVHVNSGSTIGHDTAIGDFTTIAPGVTISGHVSIGPGAYLGAGASVVNGRAGSPLAIGAGAVVAAGACVTRPVEAGAMVAGVPAVRKK